MIDKTIAQSLLKRAYEVRENAHVPYSHFKVGAALLCGSGKIYAGCNVENVSYGGTICAERSAVCAAAAAGERDFCAIAIAAEADGEEGILPCGICRQVLAEFAKPGLPVVCATKGGYAVYTLSELLPHAFDSFTPEKV